MPENINPLMATGQLPPVRWLTAPETATVTAALTAEGSEVRFVGGCVRDALRHIEATDIDIATPDTPDTVLRLLENAGIRALPTGLKHGTITAIVDARHFEITTLRKDTETDGRHAKVDFTDDWLEDAKRRDFTFNALYASLNGDVYDPFSGLWDLAHGQVRFIGSAHERVQEDYLRILRYFRFYGLLGRPPIDSEAIAACRAFATHLKDLSGERVRVELLKILRVPDPAEILIKMKGAEVLEQILPEAGDVGPLRTVNWLETRAINLQGIDPDPIRHLGAAIRAQSPDIDTLAERLKLSNEERTRLSLLCAPPHDVDPEMGELAEKRALRKFGVPLFQDLALLNWGQEMYDHPRLSSERKKSWVDLLERTLSWVAPVFPVKGQDVLTLGIEAGPKVGKLLSVVETWWENGNYKATRQECLNRLFDEARRIG